MGTIDSESENCGIAEGAFYRKAKSAIDNYPNQAGGNGDYFGFDASRCSSEYVNGATLQPSALKTLVCIKT